MNSTRTIVIDDSDPRITYSQLWFRDDSGDRDSIGNFGPTLKTTLHGVNQSGLIQFEFSGTAISVYGSNNPPMQSRGGGDVTANWDCFVDNQNAGVQKTLAHPQNNWPFCEIDGLPDGPHVLRLTVQPNGQTFWFDYLRYTPSANVSTENELLRVDNTDPAMRLGAGWRAAGDIANTTNTPGSMAAFDFFGTSIAWYGIYDAEARRGPSRGSWSVDGSPSQTFEFPGLPEGATSTAFNQVFFQTPSFPLGRHVLTVFYESLAGARDQTPFTLDYVLVQNGTGAPMTTITASAPTSSSASVSAARSRAAPALIAAVVCGILLFLLLLALGILLFRRNRKRKQADRAAAGVDIIEPYTLRPPPSSNTGHRRQYSFGTAAIRATVVRYARSVRSAWSGGSNGGGGGSSNAGPGRHRPKPIPSPTTSQIQREERRVIAQSKLLQPVRNSLLPPIPSGSGTPAEVTRDRIESMPYHGGIQTWGDLKAQEAAAHRNRQRDSYM